MLALVAVFVLAGAFILAGFGLAPTAMSVIMLIALVVLIYACAKNVVTQTRRPT
jgi:hypothetical protein